MANVVPYINFDGKSQEAVKFYKEVFSGNAEEQSEDGRVIHFDFQAGNIHFMGRDQQGDDTGLLGAGGCSLVLNCDSEEELRSSYAKLAEGGKEVFAPMDSGWGAIVAHCIDQFGVTWLLNYDVPHSS